MRSFFLALIASLFASSALADQTDPRLDLLFEELRTGQAARVDENVNRILEIWSDAPSDTVDLLFARANMAIEQGALDLSLVLLDHVIGLAPNFSQGYAVRAVVRQRNGDYAGAREDFVRALELEPRQFQVRLALAVLLDNADEKRAAFDMLQKGLEWNPHDETMRDMATRLRRQLERQEI